MYRNLGIALSLLAVACMPSKAKVAATPSTSVQCKEEGAAAVVYVVDGKSASCTAAMALPANRIASVEVLKGPAAAAYGASTTAGVVIIQTKRDR